MPIILGVNTVSKAVSKEINQLGEAVKYVIVELGKDIKATGSYIDDATTRVGVNIQNSQVLTNINNAIPKEYKIAFGIEATTGTMVESLYYLDGSKEVNLPNLINSGYKLIVDSSYGSLVHKMNPLYGVGADTLKGIFVDDKNFIISINDSARASTISSFIEGRFNNIKGISNTGKFISSFSNKYIEYKAEQKEENK